MPWLCSIFGTYTAASDVKKTFSLPRSMMNNSDLARIINSDEIQTKVRAAREGFAKPSQKRNPLKNLGTMLKLNPYITQVIAAFSAPFGESAKSPRAALRALRSFRASCSLCCLMAIAASGALKPVGACMPKAFPTHMAGAKLYHASTAACGQSCFSHIADELSSPRSSARRRLRPRCRRARRGSSARPL